jgi:hypothetical protein
MMRQGTMQHVTLLALIALGLLSTPRGHTQGPSYRLTGLPTGGGGVSSGTHVQVQGTLGQVSVGRSTDDAVVVHGGLWYSRLAAPPAPDPTQLYLPLLVAAPPPALVDAPDTSPGASLAVDGPPTAEDFDHPNDNDWFRFTAQAGVSYRLETAIVGEVADTVLSLYAPDGTTLLVENDDRAPGDPASRIVWRAPASSVYHVMVRSYDWTYYGPGTAYTVRVERE